MEMSRKWLVCFASGLVLSTAAFAQRAPQQDLSGFKAAPTELPRIPRYCWGTFDEKFRQPGMEAFNLPGGCGERFNHFCPGVLSLARAKTSLADPKRRSYWLGVADDHLHYTVGGIKDLPACPLRDTVNALSQEIRTLRGGK